MADRVRWLDRYRRLLAITSALILAPFAIAQMTHELGADWPRVHEVLLIGVVGVVVWWIVEVAFAWLAAFWETECGRLVRDRGLPRATLHRK